MKTSSQRWRLQFSSDGEHRTFNQLEGTRDQMLSHYMSKGWGFEMLRSVWFSGILRLLQTQTGDKRLMRFALCILIRRVQLNWGLHFLASASESHKEIVDWVSCRTDNSNFLRSFSSSKLVAKNHILGNWLENASLGAGCQMAPFWRFCV